MLCGRIGTLEHILSSCSVALSQGRYRWRHDSVLRQLAHYLEQERSKVRHVEVGKLVFVPFVKENKGGSLRPSPQKRISLLDRSEKWEMRVDLNNRLFP